MRSKRSTEPTPTWVNPLSQDDLAYLQEDVPCVDCNQGFRRYQIRRFGYVCPECRFARDRHEYNRAKAEAQKAGPHGERSTWGQLFDPMPPAGYRNALGELRRRLDGTGVIAMLGERGTGKTQVAQVAVCDAIQSGKTAVYKTYRELLADLRRRYGEPGSGGEAAWYTAWTNPDLLIIDELGLAGASEHDRLAFETLVDARYRKPATTLLVGNVAGESFAAVVGESVADRCRETGGFIWFGGWPSFRNQKGTTT